MALDRGEVAAARVAAAGLRAEQLRERIERLRAGEVSTAADVALAKASAAHQRDEAVRAHERLMSAYAAAAGIQRLAPPATAAPGRTEAARPGVPTSRGQAPSRLPAEAAEARSRSVENQLLRRALASIASSGGGPGGWSRDRRQELWQTLIDQCGTESWQGWSHALCRTATTLLPGVRGVAVSGYDNQGVPHLLAVADEWTRQMEEVGQLVREGPGLEAHRLRTPVLVQDLTVEQTRWPGYVAAAAGTGVSAISAFPVQLNGIGLASLTLYHLDHLDDGDARDGSFLAAVAAKTLLADLDAMEDGFALGDPDDRVQIAVGMLAVQLGVGPDDASARLRAFAFSNARRLGEVAASVVDGSLRIA